MLRPGSKCVSWHGALVIVIGLSMLFSGCNGQTAVEVSSATPASSPATSGSDEEPQRCVLDGDCETFYRCIDRECSVPQAMTGDRTEDTPVVTFVDDEGVVVAEFYLELAVSRDEQARGLMFRPHMLDDWGMLFIYNREQDLAFWMRNTMIPLDMIFIDDGGRVVGVVEEAEPHSVTPRSVGEPARYVLEVNGGLARRHGIDRGAQMSLENVEARHQPRH